MSKVQGQGTAQQPWQLKTPPGVAEYQAYKDEAADPPALVVQVGKTQLRYHLRCIADLQAMLRESGDWVALGSADEQKPAAVGTVEAWGRSPENPVKGFYGLKKGLRGRFGMYKLDVALRVVRLEGGLAFAAYLAGADEPAYFILLEFEQGRVASIRDFRYVPYIAVEAEFELFVSP
jgi:hypothetical protein